MAISSTRCCLNNVSPPPPTALVDNISSSTNTKNNKPSLLAWPRARDRDIDDKWIRKQCVNVVGVGVGVAWCMIVGLQGVGGNINGSTAVAGTLAADEARNSSAWRWSDKRMCPPWHPNSLETIVPENLPRPSAHRRWEAIANSNGNSNNNINGPSPKVTITIRKTTSNPCFSM